jgi:single-strand DNA-binding protein
MASQIQMVIYEGFLAEDPEMRYTPQGKPVTNFRMGSNRQYKTADGTAVKETTWLKITAWSKLGEIVNQLCGKGSHVIVIGKLRPNEAGSPNTYQLKSGEWAASFEITADEVRVLKGKPNAGGAVESDDTAEVDLPF